MLTAIVDIDLQAGSDTGVSDTDNITRDNTPTYDVTVNGAGTIEIDFDGDACPSQSTPTRRRSGSGRSQPPTAEVSVRSSRTLPMGTSRVGSWA